MVMTLKLICLGVSMVLLQGCASTRDSYRALIIPDTSPPAIHLSVGERKEILSISDGFPGWWGFYPTMVSFSPRIASVSCQQERSWIPFRNPGVIFGGTVCYVTAHTAGQTWLKYGNKYADDLTHPESGGEKIRLVIAAK